MLAVILAYLAGSIPTAVWVSKVFYKEDIRHSGSKNAGLTNIFRVYGLKAAVPVAIIDLGKGVITTLYGYSFTQNFTDPHNFALLCGGICILGHTFTIFEKFKGGKGVLTALGVFLVLIPYSALAAFTTWVIVLWKTGYVSLASILAAGAICLFSLAEVLWGQATWPLFVLTFLLGGFIIFRHKSNIDRLLNGTENQFGNRGKT